jgi:hypothetical protein
MGKPTSPESRGSRIWTSRSQDPHDASLISRMKRAEIMLFLLYLM